MNREEIIKLAEDLRSISDTVKSEIIAAQQARIAELIGVVAWYCRTEIARFNHSNDVGDKALSRTDDLSALNEAKAQVLEEAARTICEDNFAYRLMRMAQELRAKK